MSEIMETFEPKVGHDELMAKLASLNDHYLALALYGLCGSFNASKHHDWGIFRDNVEMILKTLSKRYPEVKAMLESVKVN